MSSRFVDLDARISSLEDVQLKVLVPRPAELALEALVVDLMTRVAEFGEVSRGEVIGALVLEAHDREDLPAVLARYRESEVHEFWPRDGQASGRRKLPVRLRGRPKRQVT